VRRAVLILAAGLALTACGETPRAATEPRVRLKLDAPDDPSTFRADHVAVRGTVVPADATVHVRGEEAEVSGGEFVADVGLQPGGNVIDVTASSPGRRPATGAVRVIRDMRVEVPDVVGRSPEDASEALDALGLRAAEQRGGGWLDRLLPGDFEVCATSPRAGTLLDKGSRVTLETARDC
jgi:hypothetical protein